MDLEEGALVVDVRRCSDATVLSPRGEIDLATSPMLRQLMLHVLAARPRRVIISLAEVDFCDAGGLNAMVAAKQRANACAVDFRIAAPSRSVARLLELTKLNAVLAVHPTVSAALDAANAHAARDGPPVNVGVRTVDTRKVQLSGFDDIPEPEVACHPAIEGNVMNIMYRNRDRSIDSHHAQEPASPRPTCYGMPSTEASPPAPHGVDRGRIVGYAATAVVFATLSAFMLQNTGTTEFSFLWMRGSTPMAVALLSATAGGLLLAQFGSLVRRRSC
jgi:anti-anti-sigma factor